MPFRQVLITHRTQVAATVARPTTQTARLIIEWKAKLKKAEKSYQECISSGEDTPEKRRVVESKQKTVDECLEMIRTYEAELNSLK